MLSKICLKDKCGIIHSVTLDSVSNRDSFTSGDSFLSSDSVDYDDSVVSSDSIGNTDKIPKKFICNNCNIVFKNKQTLNLHNKTVNCKNNNINHKNVDKTVCEYCQKSFSSKQMKNYHQSNCIEKIKQELIDSHKAEIEKIKNEYEDIIEKLRQ